MPTPVAALLAPPPVLGKMGEPLLVTLSPGLDPAWTLWYHFSEGRRGAGGAAQGSQCPQQGVGEVGRSWSQQL
jgi:hypothetical protein